MAIAPFEQPRTAITHVPSSSMVDNRYKFVTSNAAGNLVVCGAGAKACGVLQTAGEANEPCNVMVGGVSFIMLGGTVTAGAEVQSDANGAAVVLASGKSNGICLFGGTSGKIGCILVK